jgi:hypothetical protein
MVSRLTTIVAFITQTSVIGRWSRRPVTWSAAGGPAPHWSSTFSWRQRCPCWQLLDRDARIMARDALRAAVALTHGLDAICSYDRDFDRIPGITRLEPEAD